MDGKISISLVDVMGRRTSVRIETTGADVAAMYAEADVIGGLLAAITKLGVVKAQLVVPLTGFLTSAAAGSNTDVDGKVRGISDDDGDTVVLRIPNPLDAIVRTDGTLDLDGVAIAAYLDKFETGGTAMLSDGEQVASWLNGVLDAR